MKLTPKLKGKRFYDSGRVLDQNRNEDDDSSKKQRKKSTMEGAREKLCTTGPTNPNNPCQPTNPHNPYSTPTPSHTSPTLPRQPTMNLCPCRPGQTLHKIIKSIVIVSDMILYQI